MSQESRARHRAARIAGGADKIDRERWLDIVEKAIKNGTEIQRSHSFTTEAADLQGGMVRPHRQVILEPDYVAVRYDDLLSLESTLAQLVSLIDRLEEIRHQCEPLTDADRWRQMVVDYVAGEMRRLLSIPHE